MELQHIYLMSALHTTQLLHSINLMMFKNVYLNTKVNYFKSNFEILLSCLFIILGLGFSQNIVESLDFLGNSSIIVTPTILG